MGPVADQGVDWDPDIRPAAVADAVGSLGPRNRVVVVVGRNLVGMGIGPVRRSLGSAGRSTRCDPVGWRYRRRRIGRLVGHARSFGQLTTFSFWKKNSGIVDLPGNHPVMVARRSLDGEEHRSLLAHHRTEALVGDNLAEDSLEIDRIPAEVDSRRTGIEDTGCMGLTCWEYGRCSTSRR